MDLAEWLLDRIAEDEAAARAATAGPWEVRPYWFTSNGRSWATVPDVINEDIDAKDADHIARHDPARVLAECEAKRAIVEVRQTIDAHVRQVALTDQEEARDARNTRAGLDVALKALALPYASHESYREEWKP